MGSPTLVVVGSGLAGLLTARLAAEKQHVTLITKNTLFDSNTRWSQGGIAAVWGDNDSVELHIRDTAVAGSGICDPQAVEVLSRNSHDAIEQLISLGVCFDKGDDNRFLLGLEGSHSVHRILHAGGDATGAEIQRGLVESVIHHPNIELREHCLATSLIRDKQQIRGIRFFHEPSQKISEIFTSQVVIATGGAGKIYQYTSNPDGATGDGMVLAYCAGAKLMDLEFYQFHPTALNLEGAPNFLISEAVRGEGAILRNVKGERFMEKAHPLRELAPRDIVARAIAYESTKQVGHSIYLDATSLNLEMLPKRFPTIFNTCLQFNIDIRKDWIPITPVAHYMMGGVATDIWGRTSVPGLYACGEVTRTGVHGANRLASNSLLEAAVFSIRTASVLQQDFSQLPEWPQREDHSFEPIPAAASDSFSESLKLEELQKLMWDNVGIIRNADSLNKVCRRLPKRRALPSTPSSLQQFELECLHLLGRLIAESALERQESRGAHFREDFPKAVDPFMSSTVKSVFDQAN
ncbi:L-aspartate oxidase [Deltaproteobacteria bacterium TL4]